MDWHHPDCFRPDILWANGFCTCLSCGSLGRSHGKDNNQRIAGSEPSHRATEKEYSDQQSSDVEDDEINSYSFPSDDASDTSFHSSSFDDDHGVATNLTLHSNSNPGRHQEFVYKRINQREELRLLRIHQSGDLNEPIECTMTHETLRQILPPFEAISYTWADETGDLAKKATIYVDSRKFTVTTNCERALRRARLKGRGRVVWVDAICINQDSETEKTHQVQLMAQIYARANRVLVYVGEDMDKSRQLLEILGDPRLIDHDCEAILKRDKLEKPLSKFLSRPYFWRVWVLQEIALAKQAILVCGDKSTSWTVFAGRRLVATHSHLRPDHLVSKPDVLRALQTFQAHHGGFLTCLPPALGFKKPIVRDVSQMLHLLDMASFCDASDPRDKVYALLGLVTGLEPFGFVPDYSETIEDVYVDIAVLLAEACGPMAVLTRAVCRPSISRRRTWVPDWRHAPSYIPSEDQHTKITKAIQATQPPKRVASAKSLSAFRQAALDIKLLPVCSLHDVLFSGHGLNSQGIRITILPADSTEMIELDIPKTQDYGFLESTLSTDFRKWMKNLYLYSTLSSHDSSRADLLHDQCIVLVDSHRQETKGLPSGGAGTFRGLCTFSFVIRNPKPTNGFWHEPEFQFSITGGLGSSPVVHSFGWEKKPMYLLEALKEIGGISAAGLGDPMYPTHTAVM